MDKEKQIIRQFLKALGSDDLQSESFFQYDAQPFELTGQSFLFTTDEFSHEDHFNDKDPYTLGWNVTAATLSDILAAGGKAYVYGHGVTVASSWDSSYIEGFARGVADCLGSSGTTFIGGDLGMGDSWKYTGIAIGSSQNSLCRKGANAGDVLYMTGQAGGGNLQAALLLFHEHPEIAGQFAQHSFQISLRGHESRLISQYGTACIDSSDGLFQAVKSLAEINGLGFELTDPAVCPEGILLCQMLNMPYSLLFMGECGEYELVFTLEEEKEKQFLAHALSLGLSFSRIGRMLGDKRYDLRGSNATIDLSSYAIFARDYPDIQIYLNDIIKFLQHGK